MPGIRTRVPLKDGAYAPDYETLRKTYWLFCRHTSVTYITRMTELLAGFTQGLELLLAKKKNPGSFKGFLSVCYGCLDDLNEGVTRLRKADHTGFKLIRKGLSFRQTFSRAMWEYDFKSLGFEGYGKPIRGSWLWMERAMHMSLEIDGSLCGQLTYPLLDVSKYKYPHQLGGYPLSKDVFIKNGEDIPTTGVWQPISLKGGCPNFLVRGEKAPKAEIPILRIDTAPWDENMGTGLPKKHHEADADFDMCEFPSVWQLIWEDDRWKSGREPLGEYEYLEDPATDLPKEPPVLLEDPPKSE